MKRLTTDDTKSIFYCFNLFFVKDNQIWIRGRGAEPDCQDCTLADWIGRVADKHNLDIFSRDEESLGEEMYDCLQDGVDTIEGVVALLHTAAVQAAEMRWRLSAIEDILGDEYDLDRLKEMVEGNKTDVSDFPAADVAPVVHGRWLNFYGDFTCAECSKCGAIYDVVTNEKSSEEIFREFEEEYKFCPNCGAKMDLEDDKQ